jgi:uncharacterized membrane protein YhaH (DUF805 family)
MYGRINWAELLLSSTGRISRTPFVIAGAVLLLLILTYESVVHTVLHWLTGWFVYPAAIYIGVCVLSKRLHDRGRSGWWAAPIIVALIAVWPRPDGFFDFLFAVLLLWAFVELGLMAGERGANRFGPRPTRAGAAAAA